MMMEDVVRKSKYFYFGLSRLNYVDMSGFTYILLNRWTNQKMLLKGLISHIKIGIFLVYFC